MNTTNPSEKDMIPIYRAMAEDIKSLGVERVFGLMSDDIALLISSLEGIGLPFIRARHESNAVAMAEGYASATGKLGIAIIGFGPGHANGVHGSIYASRTGSPVLIILGAPAVGVPAYSSYGPEYKSLRTLALLEALDIKAFHPESPTAVRGSLLASMEHASTGKTVVLALPKDLQVSKIPTQMHNMPIPAIPARPAPPVARSQAINEIVDLLNRSKKPIILAGIGAYRSKAYKSLVELAKKTGALLGTTLKASSMFKGNPYDIGIVGGFSHSLAKELLGEADCVIAFGAGLNLWTTQQNTLFPQATVVQVDHNRENISRYYHADISLVGDARLVAEDLVARVADKPIEQKSFHDHSLLSQLQHLSRAKDISSSEPGSLLDPREIGIELEQILPKDRVLISDLGNFVCMFPYISVQSPDHIKLTGDFHSVGIGIGPAMGYACANPDKTNVFLVGDGGFLMEIGELETIARENYPILIVVLNDSTYGAEKLFLEINEAPRQLTIFPEVDFAGIAKGFGIEAYTIKTIQELKKLSPKLTQLKGPILLDCKTTNEVNYSVFQKFFKKE